MANHGKQRTEQQTARHYAKPSRAKRHERRWDARVEEMRAEFKARADAEEAAKVAAEAEKAAAEAMTAEAA
jgi:hypothetical protein